MKTCLFLALILGSLSALADQRITKMIPLTEAQYQKYKDKKDDMSTYDFAKSLCDSGDLEALSDLEFITGKKGSESSFLEWASNYLTATKAPATVPGKRYLKCTVTRLTEGELAADRAEVARLNRESLNDSLSRTNTKSNSLGGFFRSLFSGSKTSGQ